MSARPVVDLPQPDSPTSPSVSPSRTSMLTSVTALTLSPVEPTGNSTTRFSARSRVSPGSRRCAVPLPAISALLRRRGGDGGVGGGGGGRGGAGGLGRFGGCRDAGQVAGQRVASLGGVDGVPAPV